MSRLARLLIPTILSFGVLNAQETTGSITGVVKDATGAVIIGAGVTAINQQTAAEFRAATDSNGAYQFPLLRAGTYRIAVESKGFQRVQQMVVVNTSERPRIDVTLNVGQVTDTVNVTAETPLLQSEKSTIGHVTQATERLVCSTLRPPCGRARRHTPPF